MATPKCVCVLVVNEAMLIKVRVLAALLVFLCGLGGLEAPSKIGCCHYINHQIVSKYWCDAMSVL